jgi:hypothetical protein
MSEISDFGLGVLKFLAALAGQLGVLEGVRIRDGTADLVPSSPASASLAFMRPSAMSCRNPSSAAWAVLRCLAIV